MKNASVQHKDGFSFSLNWGVFGVELRGFWCGTEACVELKGFWCWTERFWVLETCDPCVELRWGLCGTEKFFSLKIFSDRDWKFFRPWIFWAHSKPFSGYGYFISALARNVKEANTLAPSLLIPLFLLSGFFIPAEEVPSYFLPFQVFLYYIMILNYYILVISIYHGSIMV